LQVILADKAGFCSGVNRAINHLLDQAAQHGSGSTFGPLVHNEEVVDYLKQRSVTSVEKPEQAQGSFLAIRTHGVTPEMQERVHKLDNITIIDLTCPRVQRVQKKAAQLREFGFNIIIFGNPEHPEVKGLIGWAGGEATVVSTLEELENLVIETPAGLIAQTTSDPELYEKVKKTFKVKNPDGQVYDTLCPETRLRQGEIINLAKRVDALVVVGSESSANTKALYDCCRQLKPSCRINNARELPRSFLRQYEIIGVTAGASTPPWTIKEVVESMENENLDVKNEEQFDFDVEVKVAQVGEQVAGKVARVTDEEVYVDIGAKTEAILPASEVHLEEGKGLADIFTPEDDIEVTVLETDEQEGKVVVSHKRLARDKRLKEIEEAYNEDTTMEGKVKQVVSAGLVIDLGSGVESFMPGSLVDIRYIPDFNEFKDQTLQFKVIEFNREKGKIILSRKKILEEEAAMKKEETLNSLEVGSTITGTVKRLTNFGAFVDVGNIDGLVHISELAWERIGHPSEVLSTGEQIEVKVLEVIPEKERISLSIRKTQPDPWTRTIEELESGQIITGKITRLVNFGAFIEIKPGVEGLAHISQLADYHVNHPSEILKEGKEVEVKILEVKPKAKRISLSVKEARGAAVEPQEAEAEETEDGSVTLGDVFGNLFDKEQLTAAQEEQDEQEEQEEQAVQEEQKEEVQPEIIDETVEASGSEPGESPVETPLSEDEPEIAESEDESSAETEAPVEETVEPDEAVEEPEVTEAETEEQEKEQEEEQEEEEEKE